MESRDQEVFHLSSLDHSRVVGVFYGLYRLFFEGMNINHRNIPGDEQIRLDFD